jgi:hypothetical protein
MGLGTAIARRVMGLMGGVHERAGRPTPTRWPHRTKIKGGSKRAQARVFDTDRRDPPGREKKQARAGLAGLNGPKGRGRGRLGFFLFFFYTEFSNPFFFYFILWIQI